MRYIGCKDHLEWSLKKNRIMNLRFLSPKLIEDVLYGKQDPNLMIADLYKLVMV